MHSTTTLAQFAHKIFIARRDLPVFRTFSRRSLPVLFLLIGVTCVSASSISCNQAARSTAPELSIKKEGKVAPGVTLIPQEGNETVLLVDDNGKTIHRWKIDADRARLLPDCTLLVIHGTKWGMGSKHWKALRRTVAEYSPSGEMTWKAELDDVVHHDTRQLENGDTLLIRRTIVPENVRMQLRDPARRRTPIRSDSVIRINRAGLPVWTWHAHEHLDLNELNPSGYNDPVDTNDGKHRMFDWTHTNSASLLVNNKWFRQGDSRFRPGNLLIHLRNWSRTMVIDQDTGKPVWEYHGDFEGGISGGHDATMIPEPLPGAGNILIFDNGRMTHPEQSIALEVDPTTSKVVWNYQDGKNFFSRTAGSLQRLENGNTLISEDKRARVFEVTPQGEIVWEYRSKFETNRAARYPASYCGQLRS